MYDQKSSSTELKSNTMHVHRFIIPFHPFSPLKIRKSCFKNCHVSYPNISMDAKTYLIFPALRSDYPYGIRVQSSNMRER